MEQILELLVDLGSNESNSKLESLTATVSEIQMLYQDISVDVKP